MHIYDGKTWLMNGEGTLFTTIPKLFFQQDTREGGAGAAVRAYGGGKSGWLPTVNAEGEKCTLFYAPVPYSRGWIFCALVNNKDIFRGIDGMIRGLLGMCAILLASSVFRESF